MASSSTSTARTPGRAPRSPESYQELRERYDAAEILQSYEKLSWYSFQRNESPMQTRLHFQNVVAGFRPADEAELVDWKEDYTPHPPQPGAASESRSHRKGKERVVSAGGGDGVAGASGVGGSSPGKAKATASASGLGSGGGSAAKKKRKSAGGGGGSGERRG